jgi:hypothetical protein
LHGFSSPVPGTVASLALSVGGPCALCA